MADNRHYHSNTHHYNGRGHPPPYNGYRHSHQGGYPPPYHNGGYKYHNKGAPPMHHQYSPPLPPPGQGSYHHHYSPPIQHQQQQQQHNVNSHLLQPPFNLPHPHSLLPLSSPPPPPPPPPSTKPASSSVSPPPVYHNGVYPAQAYPQPPPSSTQPQPASEAKEIDVEQGQILSTPSLEGSKGEDLSKENGVEVSSTPTTNAPSSTGSTSKWDIGGGDGSGTPSANQESWRAGGKRYEPYRQGAGYYGRGGRSRDYADRRDLSPPRYGRDRDYYYGRSRDIGERSPYRDRQPSHSPPRGGPPHPPGFRDRFPSYHVSPPPPQGVNGKAHQPYIQQQQQQQQQIYPPVGSNIPTQVSMSAAAQLNVKSAVPPPSVAIDVNKIIDSLNESQYSFYQQNSIHIVDILKNNGTFDKIRTLIANQLQVNSINENVKKHIQNHLIGSDILEKFKKDRNKKNIFNELRKTSEPIIEIIQKEIINIIKDQKTEASKSITENIEKVLSSMRQELNANDNDLQLNNEIIDEEDYDFEFNKDKSNSNNSESQHSHDKIMNETNGHSTNIDTIENGSVSEIEKVSPQTTETNEIDEDNDHDNDENDYDDENNLNNENTFRSFSSRKKKK